ncbi:MAG: energy-coupling factor transporter transmembrane protein EcfT [Clostridiales bacterium]|jgi:energy-coupling factor transport system permease protein|nr:energy-coupling factor transporter transmembrane protein EcfT [Clostridiales bacterium]
MLRDVAFGQYYPVDSYVHRLDPRVKLILVVLFIAAIFLSSSWAALGACALLLLFGVAFSRVAVSKVLKSIKPILFLIIFSAVLNLLFYREGTPVLSFWIIQITDRAIRFTVLMAVRLSMLIMGSSLLTLTTTPVALTDGIESLLKPLKAVRFPVHELALIMSIALRFIPTLMEETDRIINAQKARGADFESGNIVARAKALLPILIPLLISAFRRANELSDAMDSRCYTGSKGRTKMKKLKVTYRDHIALFVSLNIMAFIIIDKVMALFPAI